MSWVTLGRPRGNSSRLPVLHSTWCRGRCRCRCRCRCRGRCRWRCRSRCRCRWT